MRDRSRGGPSENDPKSPGLTPEEFLALDQQFHRSLADASGNQVVAATMSGLRSAIEERHRQLKCFQDLTAFRSRAFSLVVHQVVFTLLTYGLLQWQLHRQERAELNRKTLPRVRDHLLPGREQIMIFYNDRFAIVDKYEYTELLLTLQDGPRQKILEKTRQLRRMMYELPGPRRGPPD